MQDFWAAGGSVMIEGGGRRTFGLQASSVKTATKYDDWWGGSNAAGWCRKGKKGQNENTVEPDEAHNEMKRTRMLWTGVQTARSEIWGDPHTLCHVHKSSTFRIMAPFSLDDIHFCYLQQISTQSQSLLLLLEKEHRHYCQQHIVYYMVGRYRVLYY